jgi:hypothetical protein
MPYLAKSFSGERIKKEGKNLLGERDHAGDATVNDVGAGDALQGISCGCGVLRMVSIFC